MRVSSFIQKRLQKASETARPEIYASFVSCQHLDKPFL